MKLYMHPASPASRGILLFTAESGIELDLQIVDLMTGEQCQPSFQTINPVGLVPVLEDDDFRLTESSAILKYLADKADSPAYPKALQDRARVNEAMDWCNVNLYRDLGHNLVYPQLFPHHKRRSAEGTDATVEWGRDRTRHWLRILDQHIIGPRANYLCLDRLTIADFFGAGLVTLADVIQFDFSGYPNVARWIDTMKALPNWSQVNVGFYGLVESCKGQTFLAA